LKKWILARCARRRTQLAVADATDQVLFTDGSSNGFFGDFTNGLIGREDGLLDGHFGNEETAS